MKIDKFKWERCQSRNGEKRCMDFVGHKGDHHSFEGEAEKAWVWQYDYPLSVSGLVFGNLNASSVIPDA
ncbi:hypothetical protein LCGC14_1116640 [marine sediment metagenome]|uniref:Uncharacterized protein n=1 Tax=marine sediment metagenome TaxID=412755 RepID=A0A0F9M536_9ZZZZ